MISIYIFPLLTLGRQSNPRLRLLLNTERAQNADFISTPSGRSRGKSPSHQLHVESRGRFLQCERMLKNREHWTCVWLTQPLLIDNELGLETGLTEQVNPKTSIFEFIVDAIYALARQISYLDYMKV